MKEQWRLVMILRMGRLYVGLFLPSIVQQRREFSDYWRMQAWLFISCIECSIRLTVDYRIISPLRSCFFSSSNLWYSSNCNPILYDGTNDLLDGANDRLGQPARWNEWPAWWNEWPAWWSEWPAWATGLMERMTGLGNRLDESCSILID